MKVESLHIYPIKSCAEIQLQEIEVGLAGPLQDREWMIVDAEGKFLTQRSHSQLAVIQPRLLSDTLEITIQNKTFELPLIEDENPFEQVQVQVQVWSSKLKAQTHSNKDLATALNEHLKQPVKLVRYGSKSLRKASKSGSAGLSVQTRFTDRAPLLIVNLSSLQDLNTRLSSEKPTEKSSEIPSARFRPNVVLSGSPAWSEDHWDHLQIGEILVEISQSCGRCPIVNIDPKTGITQPKEVLRKLSEFRRRGSSINFGVLGLHRNLGKIKVGDLATIKDPV